MARDLELSGWGHFPVAHGTAERPERLSTLERVSSSSQAMVARGLGRSYGDAAFCSAGTTVLMERLQRMLAFDDGLLTAEAAVSLADVLNTFAPLGFAPPVLPGTKWVTLGGAVAADIHGKNHHRDGSISRHVRALRILTADGALTECSRETNSDLFWATVGGMGLTGIIVDVTLQLRRTNGALIVDQQRAHNLDAALKLFEQDDAYTYSVAWIDCLAKGSSLGRSVLIRANESGEHHVTQRYGSARIAVPGWMPNVLRPAFVRMFNRGYYTTHGDKRATEASPASFFFPLDAVDSWNNLYGKRGFVQYQFVVPYEATDTLRAILQRITGTSAGSFLAVLKRFGAGESEQLLSFPQAGYTLAVDFPVSDELLRMLDELDEMVARAGGRVYLAKDARMRPDVFRAMYPQLPQWLSIKRRFDPNNKFRSDLSARLGLN